MAARNKFIAETGVEETKMVLGWFFNLVWSSAEID
jgi:hypothetical protein